MEIDTDEQRLLIQRALLEDNQVKNEREYYIALYGKESELDENPTSLKEKIKTFIDSSAEHKTLIITGEAGSGKSLFSKLYALEELQGTNANGYIFMHASLSQIDDPFENLIEKACAQRDIKFKDQSLLENFMRKKIIWIFDAYDEIHFRDDDDRKKNIYRQNDLLKKLPNSKFIFTCKKEAFNTFDKDRVFDAETVRKKILYTAAFDTDRIFDYIKNFVAVRTQKADAKKQLQKQGLLDPNIDIKYPWSYTKYEEVFKYLQNIPGMVTNVLSNPLYLKITTEVVPYIEEKAKNKNLDFLGIFRKSFTSVKTELADARACLMAALSSAKFKSKEEKAEDIALTLNAVDYLKYSVEVALAMKKAKVNCIQWHSGTDYLTPQQLNQRKIFEPFFSEEGVDENGISNRKNYYLKKECLVLKRSVPGVEVWGFIHNDISTYYQVLGEAMGGLALRRVSNLITKNDYKFNEKFGCVV